MVVAYLVRQLDSCALLLLSSAISFSLEVGKVVVPRAVFLSRCQVQAGVLCLGGVPERL